MLPAFDNIEGEARMPVAEDGTGARVQGCGERRKDQDSLDEVSVLPPLPRASQLLATRRSSSTLAQLRIALLL